MASSGGGGGRRGASEETATQTRERRPALPRQGTPPRRVAMPRPNAQGTYRVSAEEFERATGRSVGRGRNR